MTAAPARRIVCIGDVMVDILARLSGELALGSDLPAPIDVLGGGSAANTASWIASTGTPVTLAGRIGDDAFGAQAIRQLCDCGVEPALVRDPSRPTGRCIVPVSAEGERTMVPDPGANAALMPADLGAELFRPGRHLHLSGYSLFGTSRAAGLHALAQARAAGMTISVDAASAAPIAAAGAQNFLSWLGHDVMLLANADEARVLTDLGDPSRCAAELARRLGRAVVKTGPLGAVWSGGDSVVHVPTTQIAALDSTSAGDAFTAGLLAALGRGCGAADAIRAGHDLAARACSVVGGRPAR